MSRNTLKAIFVYLYIKIRQKIYKKLEFFQKIIYNSNIEKNKRMKGEWRCEWTKMSKKKRFQIRQNGKTNSSNNRKTKCG